LLVYISFGTFFRPAFKIAEIQAVPEVVSEVSTNLFDQNNLSRYTETLIGQKQEPLSLVIIADSDYVLINSFQKAGWYLADAVSPETLYKLSVAAIFNRSNNTAPMTPSFWQATVHDLGFEKPTSANSARSRHHARFWRTDLITPDGKKIYFGTASLDVGIKWLVVHHINPDLDSEREQVFNDLNQAGFVAQAQKEKLVEPVLGVNFAGDQFFTDGQAYFIYLK